MLRKIHVFFVMCGIDLRKAWRSFLGLPSYFRDKAELLQQMRKSAQPDFPFGAAIPCLDEAGKDSGAASGHYFHQDFLVAQRIFANQPQTHIDVGSRIDGFVAHVAAFRPITVLDIRPQSIALHNITFRQADFMGELPRELCQCCDSVSSLHAIEHFGLGRYGDTVCYDGHLLGLHNLGRLLRPSGKLYFSVPMGPQRIEFNAHRIFSAKYLFDFFDEGYTLDRFSFVDDAGALHENVAFSESDILSNFGCQTGCAIFEMSKNMDM